MRLAKLGKEMLFSVEQLFVGREEIRAPLKTPAWEANQEFEDASNHRNEKKGALIAGVPYPLPPIPLLFSLPPYPLLVPTPATQATLLQILFGIVLVKHPAMGRIQGMTVEKIVMIFLHLNK